MSYLAITGHVLSRFIQAAVLLHLLDPVRGEPTTYGLDHDTLELGVSRESLLKRKFLDSFALICAAKRDADSVSAVCMEEGHPQGTVLRIASNGGVREYVLNHIRHILGVLNSLSGTCFDQRAAEKEVLLCITRLDISKVRGYLKDVTAGYEAVDYPPSAIRERLEGSSILGYSSGTRTPQQFLDWLSQIYAFKDAFSEAEPEALLQHLAWAEEGRKYYFEVLKQAFYSPVSSLPRWILSILKLSRYSIAARAMIRLVSEFPSLFDQMAVEAVSAPSTTCFTPSIGNHTLQRVLRRVVGHRADEYISRLDRVWNATNAEDRFLQACSRNLTVHAEVQLLSFYDHKKHLSPSFRFMGVSKKSCYLCSLLLTAHPNSFLVSSCHQKIYPSWSPPKASDASIYRQYKILINDMCKIMEAAAKQDLECRLGSARRAIPADSTAGISSTGLSTAQSLGRNTPYLDPPQRAQANTPTFKVWEDEVSNVNTPFDFWASQEPDALVVSDHLYESRRQQIYRPVHFRQSSSMVFHIMRVDDPTRQDIVSLRDLMGPSSDIPSWTKLISIVAAEDEHGLLFKEGRDYFMVEKRIRVTNERQFLACLQYLDNLNILSSEIYVHSSSGTQLTKSSGNSTSSSTEDLERPSKKQRAGKRDRE